MSQPEEINDVTHNFPFSFTEHVNGGPQPCAIRQILPYSQVIVKDVILWSERTQYHLMST